MILMALHSLTTAMAETNKEVSKANSRIDSLIANLPGIIPSSQPFADYSVFSLPDGPSHWDINPEHIPNVTDFQAKEDADALDILTFSISQDEEMSPNEISDNMHAEHEHLDNLAPFSSLWHDLSTTKWLPSTSMDIKATFKLF